MSAVIASDYKDEDYSSPFHALQNSDVNIAIKGAATREMTKRKEQFNSAGQFSNQEKPS